MSLDMVRKLCGNILENLKILSVLAIERLEAAILFTEKWIVSSQRVCQCF